MDNATDEWDNEMNDLLAIAREQLEILHGEIFNRNVEHKVIDKCDTLIDILINKLWCTGHPGALDCQNYILPVPARIQFC
eukprot:SAG25_NODE_9002_length_392_cov_1.447099_1_plen_80_part_00